MLSRTTSEVKRLNGRATSIEMVVKALQRAKERAKQSEEDPGRSKGHSKQESPGKPVGPTKVCVKCKLAKPKGRFPPHKDTKDGLASYCKDCRAVLRKKRNETNMEARIKHHFAARMTKDFGTDTIPPALVKNMSQYLGYPVQLLVGYLDHDIQEREGISLQEAMDRGYHIDHIKPLSSFGVKSITDLAFKECWAMTNLRVIPAIDNLKKGAKDIFK